MVNESTHTQQTLLDENNRLKQRVAELEASLSGGGNHEWSARDDAHLSDSKFRGLLKNLEAGVVVHAADTSIIMSNARATELLGLSDEQMRGKKAIDPAWKFIDETHTPLTFDEFPVNRIANSKKPIKTQILGVHRSASKDPVWLVVNGFPTFDATGELSEIVISFIDITDSRVSAKQLHETLEDLRESQRIAHLGSWRLDTSTNEVVWSEELYKMYGFDPALPPPPYSEHHKIFIPESWQRLSRALPNTIETGIPYELELETVRHDGSNGWMWVRGEVVFDANGNRIGLRGAAQDITERKHAQQEHEKLQALLARAQRLESVGRLAGGVAHDFNNMLSVILGHVDIILEQLGPELPIYAEIKDIQSAAQRSADLTRQLLAYARKQTALPKVLDLNRTVEGMLQMLRRLIGEDIELAWQPGQEPTPVKMDPSQIDQVLANLCVNARDAIPSGGIIRIETGAAVFDELYCATHTDFLPGEFVRLAVMDNGCGISQEKLTRIFEPFYTTKEVGKGTGLGLATVYGIVKQNNGFINVISTPGKGTTFEIFLPKHAGQPGSPDEAQDPPIAATGTETILLVEDESSILKMATLMLKGLGYQVLAAATPDEAIRLANEQVGHLHLLMTDVVMPGMNGRDLVNIISTSHPDLKHLFMSGYAANVLAPHGVLNDGAHFIQKPFSKKELGAKLRTILDET